MENTLPSRAHGRSGSSASKTLGAGYSEDELQAVIAGKTEHRPRQIQPFQEPPFQLLVDIQAKLSEGKKRRLCTMGEKI